MTSASGLKPPVETGTGSMRSTKAAVPKGQAPTPTLVNQGEAEILRERAQIVAMVEAFERKCDEGFKASSNHGVGCAREAYRKVLSAIARGDHLTAQGGEG